MNEKKDIPEFRSRGLTRKVLVAMERAPMGCYMVAAGIISALLTPITVPLFDRVIETVCEWLR